MASIKVAVEPKRRMGRPNEYDLKEVATNLIQWSEKETSINLNGFCAEYKIIPSYITRWAKDNDEFCQAYEYAKGCLGERRERLLGLDQLHVKAYDLNAKVYDHFLKQESRQDMEFEASLRNKDSEPYTPEQAKVLAGVLNAVTKYQNAPSNNPPASSNSPGNP